MKKFKKPMTLRTHLKKLVNDLNDNFRGIGEEFDGVHQRIDEFDQLRKEFYELRDEIATNGVVRELAKLRKDHDKLREDHQELRRNTTVMVNEFFRKFEDLEHNGVATSINKLNAEVFDKKVDGDTSSIYRAIYAMTDVEPAQRVTLRGKLDAVIEHLGIDVSVKPREVIESKIVTKKVKTAKKGKK